MGDINANKPRSVEEAALLLTGLRRASRDDENNKGSTLESGGSMGTQVKCSQIPLYPQLLQALSQEALSWSLWERGS